MTIIKRILLIVLAAALVLSLAACGGEKNVEIRNVKLNEDKSMLSIEYVAKGDIPAGEGAFRISVSGDIGEVYGMSNVKDDLKSGHQHVLLFAMRPALTGGGQQIEWKVGKTLQLAGGTQVTDTLLTEDVLKLFGDSAVITVAFQLNGKTVAEKKLEK